MIFAVAGSFRAISSSPVGSLCPSVTDILCHLKALDRTPLADQASYTQMFLALLALAPQPLRILFIGNSLLNVNNVPDMVARMLESDGAGRRVVYQPFFVGHLEDVPETDPAYKAAASGNFDIVVLQAAMVSSTLSRVYPQTRGVALAKAAKSHHARVLLYVEWPRRGVDETEFTMNVYRGLSHEAGGCEIVPVCYAWNSVFKKQPNAPLWNPDGNHALQSGSFIAAACTYYAIAGLSRTPSFVPNGVDPAFAKLALQESKRVEAKAYSSHK